MNIFQCKNIGISCDNVTTKCEMRKAQTQRGICEVEHWTASTYVTLLGATSVCPAIGHGFTKQEAIKNLNESVKGLQEIMWL